MKISKVSLFAVFSIITATAHACDVCAIYAATEAQGASKPGFYLGVAEQFTHFGTLQFEGREVPNETDQHLDSSITQAIVGYAFNERFSLQVNVPYIYRSFRRPEGFAIERGSESGFGDVALVGNFLAFRKDTDNVTFTWKLLGGVKFPTGDASRIKEEFSETEIPGAPVSGIHGHDLTLGSGSFDGIIGTSIYLRYQRVFISGAVQYAIRSEGNYDYRFANDLTWSGGPGAYLWLDHEITVALQASVSGEHKGLDRFRGANADDTGVTAVYLGPQLIATYEDRISAEFGLDLPVSIQNSALQAVPDYKIRAAVTLRF